MRRFGHALNYETEKWEQFNKYIREHLFFTNRSDTSRDIDRKFGKQAVMRYIIEGGSWVKDGSREKCSPDAISFISKHKEHFLFYLAGGSRELADNNSSSQKVKTGSFAVFIHRNSLLDSVAKSFLRFVRESSVQRFNLHNSSNQ